MVKYIVVFIGIYFASTGFSETNPSFKMSFPRWGPSVRGGSVYNFRTDMEGGGAFSVNRYFVEVGLARMWRFDRFISLSAGFGQDDYHFGRLASEPWNNIDNYRVSAFARWAINDKWKAIGGPSIRSYGETGVDLDAALTAAFFGGVSYTFSDRLTLGPGFGLIDQLKDGFRMFPVVFVNWSITERLSLATGGGLAATGGPGLSLNYEFTKKWKAGLTGRYERKRFLLNGEGLFPNGVAEDKNVPLIANVSYILYPGGSISAVFGYNFSGKLSADNSNGDLVYETGYDPSGNMGIVASFRF